MASSAEDSNVIINKKQLLTQDFNTVSSSTDENVVDHSNAINGASSTISNTFTCPSLPFTLENNYSMTSPGSAVKGDSGAGHYPFVYPQQFAFPYAPHSSPMYTSGFPPMDPQMQQYFMMTHMAHYNCTGNNNKRMKIGGEAFGSNSIIEHLESFKTGLKSSFDRNLQKLEVLDRLVQTVTVKGNVQIDTLKASLQNLKLSRTLLSDLISEQVNFSAGLTSELRASFLPELKEFLVVNANIVNDREIVEEGSKSDLLIQLRREENSHLTDMSILSVRNKELHREQNVLKGQFEKLQAEFADARKTFSMERDEFNSFYRELNELLCIDSSYETQPQTPLVRVEEILEESQVFQTSIETFSRRGNVLLELLQQVKREFSELEPFDKEFLMPQIQGLLVEIINDISVRLDELFLEAQDEREACESVLSGRIGKLVELQNRLAHEALNVRMGLQGQLSDSHENCERLRRHCQELTVSLNLAGEEMDKRILELQVKESECKVLRERCKCLEGELSCKNQEARGLGIKLQEVQLESEETERRHRHDISVLERKISILEGKLRSTTSNNNTNSNSNTNSNGNEQIIVNLDPFSSLATRRESCESEGDEISREKMKVDVDIEDSISMVPSTIAPSTIVPSTIAQRIVVTFTGIRDSQRQREMQDIFKELGAVVHVGADFHDDISHVLAPRGYRSIRVLAASLTGKWIVPVEWVLACRDSGRFVSEALYGGFLNTSIRPFRLRTLWMSAAFSATNKNHPTYPTSALRVLLEKLGKARWCEMSGKADFLLVTAEEKESKLIGSGRGVLLTLDNLINMIPIN